MRVAAGYHDRYMWVKANPLRKNGIDKENMRGRAQTMSGKRNMKIGALLAIGGYLLAAFAQSAAYREIISVAVGLGSGLFIFGLYQCVTTRSRNSGEMDFSESSVEPNHSASKVPEADEVVATLDPEKLKIIAQMWTTSTVQCLQESDTKDRSFHFVEVWICSCYIARLTAATTNLCNTDTLAIKFEDFMLDVYHFIFDNYIDKDIYDEDFELFKEIIFRAYIERQAEYDSVLTDDSSWAGHVAAKMAKNLLEDSSQENCFEFIGRLELQLATAFNTYVQIMESQECITTTGTWKLTSEDRLFE